MPSSTPAGQAGRQRHRPAHR